MYWKIYGNVVGKLYKGLKIYVTNDKKVIKVNEHSKLYNITYTNMKNEK